MWLRNLIANSLKYFGGWSFEKLVFLGLVVTILALFALERALKTGWLIKSVEKVGSYDNLRQTHDVVGECTFDKKSHDRFQLAYIIVYLSAHLADWLQGPYAYALFKSYGFEPWKIGSLFICGYVSSSVFGILIGNLVDRCGRKASCLAFCVLYTLTSLLYNFKDLKLLYLGRLCAGLCTSLLWTAFDSWLVCEHCSKKKFPSELLSIIYGKTVFFNGITAVFAGVASSLVAAKVGPIGPFYLSIASLCVCFVSILILWEENFSDVPLEKNGRIFGNLYGDLYRIFILFARHPAIWQCGIVQAFFEGSMYIFVLGWSPLLPDFLDQGTVFACFMAAVMIGSKASTILDNAYGCKYGLIFSYFILGAAALSSSFFFLSWRWRFIAFCVFESCCGIHWTIFYSFRAQRIIPKSGSGLLLNVYRLPVNMVVFFVFSTWKFLYLEYLFLICSALLLCGAGCFWLVLWNVNLLPTHYDAIVVGSMKKASSTGSCYERLPSSA